SHFTSTPEGDLRSGIDGCSAPNYAVPLDRLALAFARLAARHDDGIYGRAPQTLADAMTAHPEMVSGEGRSDLELMQAGRGDWVAKIGADAVQAIGIRSAGIGIAIKIADGATRALPVATYSVLDQLGLLDGARRAMLEHYRAPVLRNARGMPVGDIRAVFALQRHV
ncbi:MAG TPA: asparaginase, partial [Telluria sp.]|nr:asparaginase [Telluria sp.]